MKKGKHEIEDYLTNRDFIQWVKNPDKPQNVFWQTWIDSNPGEKEKILKAREFILSMKATTFDLTARDYEDVMDRLMIRKKLNNKPIGYHQRNKTTDYSIFWRVAAILVLAFSLLFVIYSLKMGKNSGKEAAIIDSRIQKSTPAKQKSSFNLPDGTMVWLNQNSRLTYDESHENKVRQVYLEGEAFFEVAKDTERPFILKSGHMNIKALGTSFNVNTLVQESEVALVTGSVQVWIENFEDKDVILQSGERAIQKKGSTALEVSSFNAMEVTGWKDGVLHFQDATFSDVKSRLEHWYNVSIITEGAPTSDWNYSGTFTESSLERVLNRMSYTKGFTFAIDKDVVHLKF